MSSLAKKKNTEEVFKEEILSQMSDYVLIPKVVSKSASVFHLKDPRYSWAQSCVLTFTYGSIIITGDWTPDRNRGVIINGKDLSWFVAQMSGGYLYEKTSIEDVWDESKAAEQLDDLVTTLMEDSGYSKDEEPVPSVLGLRDRLAEGYLDGGEHEYAMELFGIPDLCLDGLVTRWRDDYTVAHLSAIHTKFRELFWIMFPDGLPFKK